MSRVGLTPTRPNSNVGGDQPDVEPDALEPIHVSTPPCFEHAPLLLFECEYVPSLHFAVAPFGFVELLACEVVDEWVVELLDAWLEVLLLDECVVAPFTPPWWLHAPCPAVDVVPSLHVTVFGVVAVVVSVSVDSAANAAVENENIAAISATREKRMRIS